jgi:uncharacterized protein YndB with AHSA1/START domain
MTQITDAVSNSVLVPLAPARAFELFTDRFGEWWPKQGHQILEGDDVDFFIEARERGRWYERSGDGSEYVWGYVRELERPRRILLAWHLSPEWSFDPDPAKATEVEVTFAPEGEGTRVTLEHRGFEVHGERGAGMRESVASGGGWGALLELYRERA